MNGELLSSWARRLAAANGITLPEICACVGDLLGDPDHAAVFDYAAPRAWRVAMAALTRIPERWVWALDLQQQFPAISREWFLDDPAQPEAIAAAFCPECFAEQIAGRRALHLRAEWTLALVTRCFRHQLPLYRYCRWCGRDQPAHFLGDAAVQCLSCEHSLTMRRWAPMADSAERGIADFERAVVEVLSGAVPNPAWAGVLTARSFRALLQDLVWMLTTSELVPPSDDWALVDHLVSGRFVPKRPYGEEFAVPFQARSCSQREAVVCAIIQVLLGPRAERYVGIRGSFRKHPPDCLPFVEILRYVRRGQDQLWTRIRQWPGFLQDRAGEALRRLESERNASGRRPSLIGQVEAGAFRRPRVQIPTRGRN